MKNEELYLKVQLTIRVLSLLVKPFLFMIISNFILVYCLNILAKIFNTNYTLHKIILVFTMCLIYYMNNNNFNTAYIKVRAFLGSVYMDSILEFGKIYTKYINFISKFSNKVDLLVDSKLGIFISSLLDISTLLFMGVLKYGIWRK